MSNTKRTTETKQGFGKTTIEAVRYCEASTICLDSLSTCVAPGITATPSKWLLGENAAEVSWRPLLAAVFRQDRDRHGKFAARMRKWLTTIWLPVNCKNEIISYELHRALGVTPKNCRGYWRGSCCSAFGPPCSTKRKAAASSAGPLK